MDAASLIGGIQIQSRAGLGGNLCNATPSGDGIGPLIVHYGTAVIAGPGGRRELAVENFCTGPGRNDLKSGEMLVSLKFQIVGRQAGVSQPGLHCPPHLGPLVVEFLVFVGLLAGVDLDDVVACMAKGIADAGADAHAVDEQGITSDISIEIS